MPRYLVGRRVKRGRRQMTIQKIFFRHQPLFQITTGMVYGLHDLEVVDHAMRGMGVSILGIGYKTQQRIIARNQIYDQ